MSLINGWYDPSLYYNAQDSSKNGIPASGKKTGMYFRCSGDWYYTYDNPFSFNSFDASDPSCIEDYNLFLNVPAAEYRNSVEYFDYGTLPQRDRDAPRD